MSPDGSKQRVLVVDDEELIADTLTQILNKTGFAATAAYGGEQARATAITLQPHYLISDVVMWPMNGFETALAIRRIVPDCKILLMSGNAATSNLLAQSSWLARRFPILEKPIHPDDLIRRLREWSTEKP